MEDAFVGPPTRLNHVPRQATDNLDQVKEWLQICTKNHYTCSTWLSSVRNLEERPTRVLELMPNGLRLRCDVSTIEAFEYLTLSHMWGDDASQQLRLVQSRMTEFQSSIPANELPPLFGEAIRITRHLGFKYLWIDSLCIVQDCDLDWMTEASRMSTVYTNAVCCIAFLFPPCEGFSRPRDDPRATSPCKVRNSALTNIGIYIMPTPPDLGPGIRHSTWPWSSRAWTFQEHVLSPRTIYYGHRNIMWECAEGFCDELLGRWYAREQQIGPPSFQKADLAVVDRCKDLEASQNWYKVPKFVSTWSDVVRDYMGRDLTQSKDRVIALVGVARAFQSEHGLKYLAGAWAESIPYHLLWIAHGTAEKDPSKDTTGPQRSSTAAEWAANPIPSWSWFKKSKKSKDELYSIDFMYTPPSWSELRIYTARLIHYQWPKRSKDYVPDTALYEFTGLQITLELATLTTPLRKTTDHKFHWANHTCPSLEERIGSIKVGYVCDAIEDVKTPPKGILLALLCESRVDPRPISKMQHFLKGLGLQPGNKKGTWKRHGYWEGVVTYETANTVKNNTIQKTQGYNGKSSTKRKHTKPKTQSLFLTLPGVKIETLTLV
jgi:hypothetical protein